MFILNDGLFICLFVCGYGIIHHCYYVYVYIFVYLIDIIFDFCCFYLFLTICREKKNFNKFVTTDQMSINLFHTFLLLLFITCCACQCVYAKEITSTGGAKKVELFKTNELISNIIKPENGKGDGENITPSAFYLPLIVAADDVMVALTGVNRTDSDGDKHVDILTKYITTEGDDWFTKATNNDDADSTGWKTQFAFQKENQQNQQQNVVNGLAAAAKGDKIYILLLNETDCSDTNCGVKFVEGTVSKKTENNPSINWQTEESAIFQTEELKTYLTQISPSKYFLASSVCLEKGKKIVFVLHVASHKNSNKIYAFVFLAQTAEGKKVKPSYVGKTESSCPSVFFPWGDKIMMVPKYCENSESKLFVNESRDMGKTWSENVGPFGRFFNFIKDKNDFTTITLKNISVLLFTQEKPKNTQKSVDQTRKDVIVWFTDGNRVQTAGRIATDDNIASSQLLHTKGGLFGLYQNMSNNQRENITLTRMDDQLKNITTVITAWNNTDIIVRELFKDILPATSGDISSFTDGLVGFLSNRSENNNWKDEYYYVNATVNGGTKVDNNGGFKFSGKNNGAKWPVGKNKEDQPYNFTNPGFTLAANVTIDVAASDKDNSVLGVGYKKNINAQKTIGLLCSKGGEWKVTDNEDKSEKEVTNGKQCQLGSTYLVAIILNNSELSVHIDGEEFNVKESGKMGIQKSANITHFYFGTDEKTTNNKESHVTVRNVLLYNRPFTKEEVEKVKIPKETKPTEQRSDRLNDTKGNDENNPHGSNEGIKGSSSDKDVSPSQSSTTGEGEEKLTSQPENSTVRGGYVGLFVCFVILAHALCFL